MTCFLMRRRNEKGKLQTTKGKIGGRNDRTASVKAYEKPRKTEERSHKK